MNAWKTDDVIEFLFSTKWRHLKQKIIEKFYALHNYHTFPVLGLNVESSGW